ncbi:hypothetical protein LR48_Vigan07g186500 [Vigna angularis]|uniref:Uncharacterized protein n=1 Tax=Phaseolus angularis TaxID=3914 RepID=A0A0L9UZM9_PHAAN|nr:hypothetical protein LR48_Vigan07g186500 [Vigna angularis]
MREEMREEISEMKKEYDDMRAQLKKEYSDMQAQLLADVRAELAFSSSQPRNLPQPSHLCISTKESCDVSPQNASPTIDVDYELFSDDALQCLVALVLQLWLLYLHRLTIERKNDHIYGFIDPVAIQGVGNKSEEVQNYLLEAFVNRKKGH